MELYVTIVFIVYKYWRWNCPVFEHKKIQNLNDYFTTLDKRQDKGVYFYRINGYSDEIGQFIKNYYKAAMQSGVIIEGKIPNPDEKNL